jgi:murein DD-endopeptidase MepM/ murein hydrolase activator NlpD
MNLKRPMYGPTHAAGPTRGKDVVIVKYGLTRYGTRGPGGTDFFPRPPGGYDDVYNAKTADAVRQLQRIEKIRRASGNLGQATFDVIWEYLDSYRKLQYRRFQVPDPPPPPTPRLVHPIPLNASTWHVCQRWHATAGLVGNWAYDWCAPPGTPILAVCDATVRKLSGRSPDEDTWDSAGVYGWSVHYEDRDGYRWYWTHFGRRAALQVGQRVLAGQIVGWVGDQRFRPDHIHGGVTSPLGPEDAKRRVAQVASSPRVLPVL